MANQSHVTQMFREHVSGSIPSVFALRFVLVSPGVYTLATSGTPAAALVEVSPGAYTLDDTRTTGDLTPILVGSTAHAY